MAKKSLFDEGDSGSASGSEDDTRGQKLQINEEYARRFEHNKKREEKHRRAFSLPPQQILRMYPLTYS